MDNFSFTQIGEFFRRMDSPESTFFLLSALVAFLFGFFIAYLLRTARISRLKKTIQENEKRFQDQEVELNTAKGKLQEATEAWELAEREKIDLLDRAQRLEADKRQLTNEALRLNSEIEELNLSNRTYAANINTLNERIEELETQPAAPPPPAEETTVLGLADLPEDKSEGSTAPSGDTLLTAERLAAFEARLAQLEHENDRLEERLEELNAASVAPISRSPEPVEAERPSFEQDETEDPTVVINPDKQIMGQRIITEDRQTDDLMRIEHIGEFVQNQLHQIGVFTYADIAAWDPARIAQVTSLIGYLPGRIEKDNWVGQAAALMAGGDSNTTTRGRMNTPADDQDLKIIGGIGPKIEQVLKESGVMTLTQLATRDPEELRSMLIQAGDKYRMHDPTTWPKQAELAAAGQLEELEAYQDQLKEEKESEA